MAGKGLADFSRRQIGKIAVEYANSSNELSGRYFCNAYGMSRSVFYHMLKKAIRESIVSEKDAIAIANKAAINCAMHGGEGARVRTLNVYRSCIKERELFTFNMEESQKYMLMFAAYKGSEQDFLSKNCIDRALLERIISRSLINGWVDDNIMVVVMRRYNLCFGDKPNALNFHDLYEKRREQERLLRIRERSKEKDCLIDDKKSQSDIMRTDEVNLNKSVEPSLSDEWKAYESAVQLSFDDILRNM